MPFVLSRSQLILLKQIDLLVDVDFSSIYL